MACRSAAQQKPAQPSQSPPRLLDGLAIAISGRFPQTTQSALQARITALGATIVPRVSSDTTILIASHSDYAAQSAKVLAAAANTVPTVSIDWLDDTESTGAKVDESQYLLTSPAPPPPPPPPTANANKRVASPALSQPAAPSPSKKRKTLPQDKTDRDNVKVGDGQNAGSSKIAVSVDEYCTLPTYEVRRPNRTSDCAHVAGTPRHQVQELIFSNNNKVYIDDDAMIWDASLNQTNASANNNKFYRVQVSFTQPDPST